LVEIVSWTFFDGKDGKRWYTYTQSKDKRNTNNQDETIIEIYSWHGRDTPSLRETNLTWRHSRPKNFPPRNINIPKDDKPGGDTGLGRL